MAAGLPPASLNAILLRLRGRGQVERDAREMTLEVLCATGPYLAVGRIQSAVAATVASRPCSVAVRRFVHSYIRTFVHSYIRTVQLYRERLS